MDINQACEAFKKILEEQQARIANMNTEKTDFSTKNVVTIGVVDGDGIGPIITKQANRVLEKVLADEIAAGTIVIKYIEGLTIENRIACNQPIPSDVLDQINNIITASANGEDPETCPAVAHKCSGSCSTCGGCH